MVAPLDIIFLSDMDDTWFCRKLCRPAVMA
jgi:hypothetical protein